MYLYTQKTMYAETRRFVRTQSKIILFPLTTRASVSIENISYSLFFQKGSVVVFT